MNQWTEPEDRLTAIDDLDAAMTLEGPVGPVAGVKYVAGLDIGLTNDRTAVAVCHRDADSVVLYRLQVWAGTRRKPVDLSEVENWVAEAATDYNRAAVYADPYQAVSMIQRLRTRRVKILSHTFSARSNAELALTLHSLLRERRIVLPDDPDLRDELANVRLRETSPGVFRLDHDQGRHDDRAIALGLATFHLSRKREPFRLELGDALGRANAPFFKPAMQWGHQ